jgi:hypothetical protein
MGLDHSFASTPYSFFFNRNGPMANMAMTVQETKTRASQEFEPRYILKFILSFINN